ncbi:MAG: acyltransferase family protein [Granulosicoccus sp.]
MIDITRKCSRHNAVGGVTGAAIGPTIRDRINAARVVCVLLMMYVHVPNGQQTGSGLNTTISTRIDHWLESILIEGPGRASAALLSVVSGYLIIHTLARTNMSVVSLYNRRLFSIVVPMVFWAVLTCLIYLALSQGRGNVMDSAYSWHEKLNFVLFIYEVPFGPTMHLGFLRDLFVCVLLSPLLLIFLQWFPAITIGILGFIYLSEHSGQLYIVLRPLVILGFTIGMFLAMRPVRVVSLDRYWAWYLSLTGVFAVLIVWANAELMSPVEAYLAELGISLKESVLYPLCRLFGSLTIWCMLPLCKGVWFTRLVNCLVPYLFVAFCSHFLVLNVLFNGLWLPLIGDRDSCLFLLWFISAPMFAMCASIAMVQVTARVFPPLVKLMTGGRMQPGNARTEVNGRFLQIT